MWYNEIIQSLYNTYGDAEIIENYGLRKNEKKSPEAIISFKYSYTEYDLME